MQGAAPVGKSRHDKRATARQKWREQIVELTPLEHMLKVMNKNTASRKRRIAMARAALPYCHTKLKPVPAPADYREYLDDLISSFSAKE